MSMSFEDAETRISSNGSLHHIKEWLNVAIKISGSKE
jgi:hypothetical protein